MTENPSPPTRVNVSIDGEHRDANDNINIGLCIYVNLQGVMEKKILEYYARNAPKILFVLYVLYKLTKRLRSSLFQAGWVNRRKNP